MNYGDIKATFRPLSSWPGPRTVARRRAPFKDDTTWGATLALLKRELRQLDATDVVIEMDLPESKIRNDGYPRADARPDTPGVVVSFQSKYGPLRYPCDTFARWEDNVRAIALAMEALRKVDRYGVTKRGEQYTGWKALPSGGSTTMSADHAAVVLCNLAGVGYRASDVLVNPGECQRAFRDAAKRTHPDAGGSTEDFQRLQEAKRVLNAHHGRATV